MEERKRANQELTRRLASKALISETARRTLEMMREHFEPEWMFRQAEHFSLCLRIPRDRLIEMLEEGLSLHGWAPVYRLAERFGVSGAMMKMRLEKLRLIEIGPDGKPRPRQPGAFLYLHSTAQHLAQPICIIFIGTKKLCNTLAQMPAVLRRVEDWCFFKEYDLNDTWMLLAELHPHFGTLSPSDSEHRRQVEFLHEVLGGYPSRLAAFILQLSQFPAPYNHAIDVKYLRTIHAYLQWDSVAALKFLKARSNFPTKRPPRNITSTAS